jgi:hypothetical protein
VEDEDLSSSPNKKIKWLSIQTEALGLAKPSRAIGNALNAELK